MGKKNSSWLTAVKRAFTSPTKDNQDNKKREKRRWIFRIPTKEAVVLLQPPSKPTVPTTDHEASSPATLDQKHALAVAVAAAEAALATAKAAAQVVWLSRPLDHRGSDRRHTAALVIQTAFRGYLARRALRALKGLVKMQALVRGHNVRKQAKTTMQYMQALVRARARALDHRMSLSLPESPHLQHISHRRSLCFSREGSSIPDDWGERPHTIEEVKAMLQQRNDASLNRDNSLSHSLSQQTGKSPSVGNHMELEEATEWKPWERKGRASIDYRAAPVKTLEIDTSRP